MSSDDTDVAIRVRGLSKRYLLGERQPYRRVGEALSRAVLKPFRATTTPQGRETIWAVKDISFDLKQGEILGIIGRNGAGKSTLLRLLSKIAIPTAGRAEVYGRVGTLLEVGTGFHPELTGRENVFLNGAILGMTKKEIQSKYDEINAFAQIEKLMETPVKLYSSGQRVRLAFSVAAHLEPEILFIDEVLAVGDAAFQQKCLGKMEEVAGAGRTVVFVSHTMGMITRLCTRAMWVDGGQIVMDGTAADVVEAYLAQGYSSEGRWVHPEDADCGKELRIRSIELLAPDGAPRSSIPFNDGIEVRMSHEVRTPLPTVALTINLVDMAGNVILITSNLDADPSHTSWEPGCYTHTATIPGGLLRPGRYLIGAGARIPGLGLLDDHFRTLSFEILPDRSSIRERRPGLLAPVIPWVPQSDHD